LRSPAGLLRQQNDGLILKAPPHVRHGRGEKPGASARMTGSTLVRFGFSGHPQIPYNKPSRSIPKFYFVVDILAAGARPAARKNPVLAGACDRRTV
jgi:hypothetical protein